MYEKFYNLREKPFSIAPNPDYLYLSEKHANALTFLEYGLSEKTGFILLTGEVGAGKTTLIKYLLENTVSEDTEVAQVFNTNVTPDQLLVQALREFNLNPVGNSARLPYRSIFRGPERLVGNRRGPEPFQRSTGRGAHALQPGL